MPVGPFLPQLTSPADIRQSAENVLEFHRTCHPYVNVHVQICWSAPPIHHG